MMEDRNKEAASVPAETYTIAEPVQPAESIPAQPAAEPMYAQPAAQPVYAQPAAEPVYAQPVTTTFDEPLFFSERERKRFKWAALLSYIPAYLYVKMFLSEADEPAFKWIMMGFALLFVGGVEAMAHANGLNYAVLKRRGASAVEAALLGACVLVQGVMMSFFPVASEVGGQYILMWHVTAVFYVSERMDAMTEGHLGPWIPLDALKGFFYYPFRHIILRIQSLFSREIPTDEERAAELAQTEESRRQARAERRRKFGPKLLTVAGSLLAAAVIVAIAWRELAEISDGFAAIAPDLGTLLHKLFENEFWQWLAEHFLPAFLLSIPVGAILFGLVGGSLRETLHGKDRPDMGAKLQKTRKLPELSAWIVLGLLIAVYALFFGVALSEFAAKGMNFTAHEASEFAVKGFWQLIRIILLNISLLAAFTVFGKPLWEKGSTLALVTALFVCALAFAGLAAVKLYGVYIGMFGLTARRLVSGWALSVLILLCVLLLVRFFKKFPAVRVTAWYAFLSFEAVCVAAPFLLGLV